ncbi:hypothetical protein [Mucisphaera calidilacus]|uniref:Dockerin domain-containing protein n=1 Tax=Mucisphaera calidilacus TaxID=2527982 RepID=A0A518BXL1_9BACT|nr:hypothetical protein [Mucisphaera calidilacus]QDU71713.1 hypothetical protein Pan265_15660 [Mucisphaera calidilacus]
MLRRSTGMLGAVIIGLACLPVGAAPLDDIAKETVTGRQTSPPNYGWNYGYDIEFEDGQLNVSMDIKLEFDEGISAEKQNALKDSWESGIESLWNNKFDVIKDGLWRFPINIEVNWVDPHHTVRVRQGPATSTSNTWDTEDNGNVAAHEFGHLFGLFDEYEGGALNPGGLKDGTSIMGVSPTASGAPPKARHYQGFLDWLKSKSPEQTFTTEPHAAGGVEIIGSYSNFDVVNNSGQGANDFELELGNVEADDITGTFPGFGDTDPEITESGGKTKIRWEGDEIPADQLMHFGVTLKDGVQAESARATWTKDGTEIAFNAGLGIDQYYAAAAGLPDGMSSTIRNTGEQELLVSFRHSEVLFEPLPLDALTVGLEVPWQNGGLFTDPIPLPPGGFIPEIFDLGLGDPIPGAGIGRSVVTQIEVIDPFSGQLLAFFTNQGVGSTVPPTFDLVLGDFNLDNIWDQNDTGLAELALEDPVFYLQQFGLQFEDLLLIGDFNGDGVYDPADLPFIFEFPFDDTLGLPTVWGDLDSDGVLGPDDLILLQAAIDLGLINSPWDFDLDGVATPLDTQFWMEVIFGSVLGDANLDGSVDLLDLSILASNFGGPGIYLDGDFNGDGVVDLLDLSILASNFGFSGGGSSVVLPEPAVFSMLGLGLLLTGRRAA